MDSERALSGAILAALGPDPGEDWVVETQPPEPEQPWESLGAYADVEPAIDEALYPMVRRAAGTLVRRRRDGSTAWLGLVTRDGRVAAEPPVSGGGPEPVDSDHWDASWYSARATAVWMLRSCVEVDAGPVILAGCACARVALRSVAERRRRPVERALSVVERAAVGRASEAEVLATGRELAAIVRGEAVSSRLRIAAQAADRCCWAAEGRTPASKYALLAAGFEGSDLYRRDLAEAVRRFVSLGALLLTLHEAYSRGAPWTLRLSGQGPRAGA